MAQQQKRKMESRSANVTIFGINAEDGDATRRSFAGTYLRTVKPDWSKGLVHYFRPEGEQSMVGIWGCAAIDRGLRTVPKGTYVELEYQGTRELDNGQEMKEIDVRVPAGTPMVDDEPF